MNNDLQNFHFDPAKCGRIFRQWLNERGITVADAAELTGMSYDTLNNCMAGRLKEVSLDRCFKIALITGHDLTELIQLMLEGEDVAFQPLLDALQPPPEAPLRAAPPPASDGIQAYLIEQVQRLRAFYASHIEKLNAEHSDRIKNLTAIQEKQLTELKTTSANSLTALQNAHAQQIQRMEETIKLQKSTIRVQRIWLFFTTLICVLSFGTLAYDLGNRNAGWFRGLFTPKDGSSLINLLKG